MQGFLGILVSVLEAPWVVLLVGLTSLILTVITLFLARQKDRFCFAVWGATILQPSPRPTRTGRRRRQATASYDRTVAWVTIWNGGRVALRSADISGRDPLRIVIPHGSLLAGTRIVKETDSAINWTWSEKDGELLISFDLLNPGEGAVFRIPHDSPHPKNVVLKGTIANVGHPVQMANAESRAGRFATLSWLAYILVGFAIIPLGLLTYGTGSPATLGFLAIWVLGDLAPAYAAYRYSDVRIVVPKLLREACVGLPELRGYIRATTSS